MKQVTRYQFLTIPGKLRGELRITVDSDRSPVFTTNNGDSTNTGIAFYPSISLSIIRPSELDENGQRIRAPWNPNDYLPMTKFNLPIFTQELEGIIQDMKIPELYTYHGKRLELNEEVAGKIRRPFVVGNVTIELSAVVIIQDDNRLEGVKLKFNNEQSSVLLTLNELSSLCDNLKKLDVDTISMLLYINWINRPDRPKTFNRLDSTPKVDILPKERDFQSDFVE